MERWMKYFNAMIAARILILFLIAIGGSARANEVVSWSDEDFAMYPNYCTAKLLDSPPELVALWKSRFKGNYLHMHHYCFGLKAMSLAYSNYSNKQRRMEFARAVVQNFEYIMSHTTVDFYMRPEALVNMGRGYQLLGQPLDAKKRFEQALRMRPDLVEAWVALSDLFYENGDKKGALTVLESAQEKVGDNPKIKLRIESLMAK
jgi:tetratricopeptide (TPR) repeat protein